MKREDVKKFKTTKEMIAFKRGLNAYEPEEYVENKPAKKKTEKSGEK